MPHIPMHYRFTLRAFLVLMLGTLVLSLIMVSPYLLAVCMGGIVALLLQPIYRRLTPHMSPKWAACLVTIGLVVIVLAPLAFFVFKAVDQGTALAQKLAQEGFSLHNFTSRILSFEPLQAFAGGTENLQEQLHRSLQDMAKFILASLMGFAAHLPDILLQLALALLACFFLLMEHAILFRWLAPRLLLDADISKKLAHAFHETAISTIWATLAAAAAQSALVFISFMALSIPAAFLATGATFILAWIPLLGSGPVIVAGIVYLYLKGTYIKLFIMIGCAVLISVIDNIARAFVLKGRSKMHPLVSLVAIFGGIHMFGILGVFIGPIIAAVGIFLLQTWPSIAKRGGIAVVD